MRALALLLVAGCAPTLPHYTVHVPPLWEAARPPSSIVFLASRVDLAPLSQALEREIPPTLEGSAQARTGAGDLGVTWKLRRQSAGLRAVDGGVELRLAMRGSVETALLGVHCRSDDIEIVRTLRGRPSLRAWNELILVAEPRFGGELHGELHCMGIPLPLQAVLTPVADLLHKGLEALLPLLRVPIGPLVRAGLSAIATPRPLTVENQAACLDLAPQALVLAPLGGQGSTLAIKLGLEVAPRLSLGNCPPPPPLPEGIVAREAILGDKFTVELALAIGYDDLEQRVRPSLLGKKFGSGARQIEIRSVELGDATGRVLARLKVKGAIDGMLYLWGTPALVRLNDRLILTVSDLQAAAETKSIVQRILLGLWELLEGGLTQAARKEVRYDATDAVNKLRAAVVGKREFGPITIEIESVEPGPVRSAKGVLTILPRLVGRATAGR